MSGIKTGWVVREEEEEGVFLDDDEEGPFEEGEESFGTSTYKEVTSVSILFIFLTCCSNLSCCPFFVEYLVGFGCYRSGLMSERNAFWYA